MEDWKQRTQLLLGDEKMERLRKAHVLVVGLGGVGAYAAEMRRLRHRGQRNLWRHPAIHQLLCRQNRYQNRSQ